MRQTCELKGSRPSTFARCKDFTTRDKDDVSISEQVEVVSRSNVNFIDCDDLGE